MITEPELTGGSGGEPRWSSGGAGQLADVVEDVGNGPVGRPAGRRGWLWGALAGAAVASAVWAGAASASAPGGRPDLHGLRIGYSPCAGGTFDALVHAVGGPAGSTTPAAFTHGPSLDGARCTFTMHSRPAAGAVTDYTVVLAVNLHRTSDPRAEFRQEATVDPDSLVPATSTTALADVGDEAYALALPDGTELVKVLRGGAVITLRLTASTQSAASRAGPSPSGSADSTGPSHASSSSADAHVGSPSAPSAPSTASAPSGTAGPAPSRLVPALADAARALLVALAQ